MFELEDADGDKSLLEAVCGRETYSDSLERESLSLSGTSR
jgi:hypothetical protein